MSALEKQTAVAIPTRSPSFPLDAAAKGNRLIVVEIPDGKSRTQLIRLGILEGGAIRVIERMPGGTVVIEKNRQEVAIGAVLAKTIMVERLR